MFNSNKKEKSIIPHLEWPQKIRKWWAIVVLIFFALVIFAFIFNLRIFWMSGKNEVVADVDIQSSSLKLDSEKLENVLENFDKKALNSNDILNNQTKVPDPSL